MNSDKIMSRPKASTHIRRMQKVDNSQYSSVSLPVQDTLKSSLRCLSVRDC